MAGSADRNGIGNIDVFSSGDNFQSWLLSVDDVYRKLTGSQRLDVLYHLTALCLPSELYEYAKNIETFLTRDFLSCLPAELVDRLLSFLDLKTLLRASCVSKQWNDAIGKNNQLWRRLCVQYGIRLPPVSGKSPVVTPSDYCGNIVHAPDLCDECVVSLMLPTPDTSSTAEKLENTESCSLTLHASAADVCDINEAPALNMKEYFMTNHSVMCKFFSRDALHTVRLYGYTDRVMAIYYHNGFVATGCDDRTLRLWDCDAEQCIRDIDVGCTVSVIRFNCRQLVIGSFNATATLYTFPELHRLRSFAGHTSAVMSIDICSRLNLLATGSADSTFKLWSLESGEMLHSVDIDFWPHSIYVCLPSEWKTGIAGTFVIVVANSSNLSTWFASRLSDNKLAIERSREHPAGYFSHCLSSAAGTELVVTGQADDGKMVEWRMHLDRVIPNRSVSHDPDHRMSLPIELESDQSIYLKAIGRDFGVYVSDSRTASNDLNLFNVQYLGGTRSKIAGRWILPHDCRRSSGKLSFVTMGDRSWLNGFSAETVCGRTMAACLLENNIVALLKFQPPVH